MLIAQLSDLHIVSDSRRLYDFIDVNSICAEALVHLKMSQLPFDCIVISGDTVNCGTKSAYAMLERLLDGVKKPLFTIPGNHDAPDFLRVIADGRYHRAQGKKMDYTVDDFPVRLVFLDTVVPKEHYGTLEQYQLSWLEEILRESEKPTLIFMHHHPIATGDVHIDPINCLNGHELIKVVHSYPHVQAILCGHTHRVIVQHSQGIPIMTAPSLITGTASNFHNSKAYFFRNESSYFLHRYTTETGLVTFVEKIPTGPLYAFDSVVSCPKTGEL